MVSLNHRLRRTWLFPLTLVVLLAISINGCGSDRDRVVVDFNKTVPAARPGTSASGTPPLRVAVAAMVSPRETFDLYRQLLEYLGRRLGKNLEFVQRKTYGEINELLRRGDIDLAFICSGPYVSGRQTYGFQPLAVPVVHGSHYYQSYLIVNKDSSFHRLGDLEGHTFAFTDPDSNTGKLVPTYWLAAMGKQPETFFGRTIYTFSHDNSIMAVSRGLVDGAAVDGLIWEYYQERKPAFTSQTRVIKKSDPYGIPPLVASAQLSPAEKAVVQKVLAGLHQDPEGKKLLAGLLIDRFIPLKEEWYDPIRAMHQHLARFKGTLHATQKP